MSTDDFIIDGLSDRDYEREVGRGRRDPFRLEWERDHDELLEARDRADGRAGRDWHLGLFDERRVRALQRPRTGNVEVQPRSCPIDEAA